MRNAITNARSLRRLSKRSGRTVTWALTRGNTGHRVDCVGEDGRLFSLWPDDTVREDEISQLVPGPALGTYDGVEPPRFTTGRMRIDGAWFFRVLGFGLWAQSYRKSPPVFSERHGLFRVLPAFGWRLRLLHPWDTR